MTSSSNRPVTTANDPPDQAPTPALNLSFTAVAGGALASVTTAVAASFLGVSGTLTGAAFGSVVSSVGAALYAASLKTAHTKIRATRTVVPLAGAGADPQDPSSLPADLTGRSVSLPGETVVMPTAEGHGGPSAGSVPLHAEDRVAHPRERRLPWKPIAVLTGLVFFSAMAVIFVTEVFLGHPISNSQQTGTSVSRVVSGDIARPPERTEPSTTETTQTSSTTSSSESPSPSATTDSPSPSDSGSLAPGETTQSGDPGASPQPSTGASGGTGQTDQSTSQPAAPTDSPSAGAGAAAPSP